MDIREEHAEKNVLFCQFSIVSVQSVQLELSGAGLLVQENVTDVAADDLGSPASSRLKIRRPLHTHLDVAVVRRHNNNPVQHTVQVASSADRRRTGRPSSDR